MIENDSVPVPLLEAGTSDGGSVGELPPDPDKSHRLLKQSRKGMGGSRNHRPGCMCNPCKARRRTSEALIVAAGARGINVAPLHAPLKKVIGADGRVKTPPKNLRERLAQYIYMKMAFPDLSTKDLAVKMSIDSNTLYNIIKNGRETGLLTFDDPLERVEHELIPKVVDNLNFFLDARDKTVTIEAAKGTLFRQYAESKGITDGATTVLALKIEQADGQEVKVMTGRIVGTPKGVPTLLES